MGTRSNIGYINEDKTVLMAYCHWDGYFFNNGTLLLKHYQDKAKIFELVSHGSLSSLGEEIGTKHDFDSREHNMCTFYHRDRDEKIEETSPEIYKTKEDALNHMEEFLYLYDMKDSKWICSDHGEPFMELTLELCSENS